MKPLRQAPRNEAASAAGLAVPRTAQRRIAPHSLFFIVYAALYLVPLWLVGTSGFGEGLVAQTGADAKALMGRIAAVYTAGIASFLLGSRSAPACAWLLGGSGRRAPELARIRVYPADKIVLAALICAFLLSKILLIPAGVYSTYAFEGNMMESPVWTASMFFSEMLVFASLLALFSGLRRNVAVFAALSLLNGINLLHGTRNFFVAAMAAAMLYGYTRTRASLARMAAWGIGGFSAAVLLAYVVYLNRQHASFGDFSPLSVLSPITYESVFSEMSLIAVLSHPGLIGAFGHPHRLVADIAIFAAPRFLVGNKESLLWTEQFAAFAPLGGFNGFAMGLLYFGYMLPAAYFLLGLAAGMLRRMANTGYGAALYVYFCCDSLYRVQRDGYVIPAKMLLDVAAVLGVLGCLHLWARRRAAPPSGGRVAAGGLAAAGEAASA